MLCVLVITVSEFNMKHEYIAPDTTKTLKTLVCTPSSSAD